MTADRGARGEQGRHPPGNNGGQGHGDGFPAGVGQDGEADGGVGQDGTAHGGSGQDGTAHGGSGQDGTAHGTGRGRRAAALAALVIGLAGLAVSVAGMVLQVMPRQFSPGEQRQIEAWEASRRWQDMPAGQIFPASVTYQLPAKVLQDTVPLDLSALRVGIAPQSDCARAVTSAAAGAVLSRNGCETVLRATYVDATRSYVTTVGVAVLPTRAAAVRAGSGLSLPPLATAHDAGSAARLAAGVQVVRFGGGATRLYTYNRQISASFTAGPYVIMYAAGYADGRPRVPVSRDYYADAEMRNLAQGVAQSVADTLAARPAVPRCPGAPGC